MSALDVAVVLSWKNLTLQEVIPDDGETREDAIRFVNEALEQWRPDLFFYEYEVREENGKYYFLLWERDLPEKSDTRKES